MERVPAGGPWADVVGYSRAVRAGPFVLVAGTTAAGEDGIVRGAGDAYAQTVHALDAMQEALERAGARLDQVVQTRLFVTDVSRWQEVGRAHGERFAGVRPVCSMVEVSALIDPRMLVEIEATAYVA